MAKMDPSSDNKRTSVPVDELGIRKKVAFTKGTALEQRNDPIRSSGTQRSVRRWY